ncbi:UNVERIFIED_CONTAM: hypothetical protein Sradi_6472900 [Sesamum radiatum]|uniref:Uncharacterized protein n=1 Tax=Sesamum radiatum TaxID=300843 RepID=A0AAW2K7A1_SESRA
MAAETILQMAPNIVVDNSSMEVFEEVQRRGESATGPMALGGDGTGAKGTG